MEAAPNRYRLKAAELQKTAASMQDGHIKDEYLKLVRQYEALAEEVEDTQRRYQARET